MSCAGTYGHILLDVDINFSHNITDQIDDGDLSLKPGWIRMSIHPTMTDEEMYFIMNAIKDVAKNHKEWGVDYSYNKNTNEFVFKDASFSGKNKERAKSWFKL